MTEYVFSEFNLGWGNLAILLADCIDKCRYIHDDVFSNELSNCVTIKNFTRVGFMGTHPPAHIHINEFTVNNIHPRMRNIIEPTDHMENLINQNLHILDGVSACVHIRRGSYDSKISQGTEQIYYYCSESGLAKFEKVIENERGRVYLATDSNEIKEKLKSRFGNKIVTLDTEFACISKSHGPEKYNIKSLQSIFLEWFMISMCPVVYVTGGRTDMVGFSTYGYSAAIYGNKPFQIIFND